jgi:hypothetical protein
LLWKEGAVSGEWADGYIKTADSRKQTRNRMQETGNSRQDTGERRKRREKVAKE